MECVLSSSYRIVQHSLSISMSTGSSIQSLWASLASMLTPTYSNSSQCFAPTHALRVSEVRCFPLNTGLTCTYCGHRLNTCELIITNTFFCLVLRSFSGGALQLQPISSSFRLSDKISRLNISVNVSCSETKNRILSDTELQFNTSH